MQAAKFLQVESAACTFAGKKCQDNWPIRMKIQMGE